MFEGCSSLESIDISHFNSYNVKYMTSMFFQCTSLKSINIAGLSTKNVEYMNLMFCGCRSLKTIDLSSLNTENLKSTHAMFNDCSSLQSIVFGNFKTNKVEEMSCMFNGCQKLEVLDLSSFETTNLHQMWEMFCSCSSLKTIYVSNLWNTNSLEGRWGAGDNMFNACLKLIGGKGTKYDSTHSDYNYAHIDGGAENPGYFTNINAINEKVILTAKSYSRTYGEPNPTFEYTVTSGTITTGVPTISCSASATSPVGTYDIVISKGTVGNNNVELVKGTLTITKAPLMIFAGNYTKNDGEDNPPFKANYSGFKNKETEAVLTQKPTLTTTATKTSTIGVYPVNVSGAEAQNYDISYKSGTLTVLANVVTLTAKNYTRIYGNANPNFEYSVNGGTIISGNPTITCSATATSPVGTYDIVIAKGTVSNSNVDLVNGTLTITKAPLTVSVGKYTREEGEDNPEFNATYSGFMNNETEAVLTRKPIFTTTATKISAAGDYPVTVSGAESQNYNITYINGTMTILAKVVKLTTNNCTKEYGEANPTFEYVVSGGTIISGTPTITCSAVSTSPVGTYDIVITKGTVSNSIVELVNGTLTITKAPLTISVGNYRKKEGEDNPEFKAIYSGFKNNETEDVLTKRPTLTCEATKYSAPDKYYIKVSGAETKNYDISYISGWLTIEVNSKIFKEEGISYELLDDQTLAIIKDEYAIDPTVIPMIIIHDGQTYTISVIGEGAFKNNLNMTQITIPNTIVKIDDEAFAGCVNLAVIIIQAENPIDIVNAQTKTNDSSIFEGVNKETCTLYVPDGSVEAYKAADGWSEFKIILPISALGINGVNVDGRPFDVYNMEGRKVRHEARSLDGLLKGVYIINGRKVVK